jgi:hypothetical protein
LQTSDVKLRTPEKLSMKQTDHDRPLKKRRISEVKSTSGDVKPAKLGSSVGALIGRKRKERKGRKS